MFLRNNFTLLLVLVICLSRYTNADFRVIGGRDINIRESPHTVAIFNNGRYECVGSLVSTTSVVTTAHCVHRNPVESLLVRAGVTNIYQDGGQRSGVREKKVHSAYIPGQQIMNIAVVKLTTSFEPNDEVKEIQLSNARLRPDLTFKVSGWGVTDINSRAISPTLKTKEVQIRQCRNYFMNLPQISREFSETFLYAGEWQNDLWFGDGGASGVRNGRFCAMAISSFLNEGLPYLYIDVTHPDIQDFIRCNM